VFDPKHAFRKLSFYDLIRKTKDEIKYYHWRKNPGNEFPPNRVKQNTVIYYAKKYHPVIFVETGTYFGDMVNAVKNYFEQIYSIELDNFLFNRAKKRFRSNSLINIIHGNSKDELKHLLPKISEQSLFWLDAHYSAGITAKGDKITPVIDELEIIFSHNVKGHIILIDDARLFNGTDDYPSIEELKNYIISKNSSANIEIKDDVIRITQ
jgi:hypothetical protein